jgi:hypothetical protein
MGYGSSAGRVNVARLSYFFDNGKVEDWGMRDTVYCTFAEYMYICYKCCQVVSSVV